ncbi:multiple monosaccharide ABC transporter permease [Allorhizobium taibaishanense]|uniref:Xylose transport system permease protein XylH n=1 Tax=Allorhizobium taibaishanense TaxID=887144 RepID=A0A1Q9A5B9_9HYPH|nr:multiple monosaccharide ABC transporter permease [Allorhizobium taibaishanense]MBB4006860.1 putative multiple sugar transport system permease protein [Allorhizobium taibaishanense]OLP49740.1 ABC transporter permease [Allorhizobium taibaishanense]
MNSVNHPTEEKHVVSIASYIRSNIREYGMLIALVAIMVFFQIYTGGILFKPVNITNLVLQNSFIVVMALGMLLVIVAGHIDLSVGSIVGFIGGVSAVLTVQLGMGFLPALIISLIVGGVIGAAQGYWIAYHRIPAFIVTLAGMLVFRGLTYIILGNKNIGPFPSDFQLISTGFIPDLFDMGGLHSTSIILTVIGAVTLFVLAWRRRQVNVAHGIDVEPFSFFLVQNLIVSGAILLLGYLLSTYRGMPNVLIVMLALIIFYSFVTRRTTVGRRIYAMGGNEKATKLSGINTERLTFLTFVNMGVLAGLAGMIVAARLNSATPKAGVGFELDVIAACFIGGASASGGVGKITGAVIGAFIMGVMNNGMSIIGLGIDYQQMVKGLVLLAAVFFDVYNKNKAA